MSVHSQIKNNGPRQIGDVLRSAGFGPALDTARTARKQQILDDYRQGNITRHEADDMIFAERLGSA